MENFNSMFSAMSWCILIGGLIQLIVLIVLIVKFLGMTNDVRTLKDLYSERSKELSFNIQKLSNAINEFSLQKGNENAKVDNTPNEIAIKVPVSEIQNEVPIKELPIIDENSDEFKKYLRKWKILKGKGYTEQAIKEYMEYTKLDMVVAVEFINSI